MATLYTRNAGNTDWRKRTLNPFQSYWNLASITSGGLCTDKAEDSQLLLCGHCGSILQLLTYSQTGQDMSRLKILFCGFEWFRRLPSLFQETPRSQGGGGGGSGEVGYEPFAKQQPQNAGNIYLGTLHWWKSHKVSISIKYFLLLEGSRFLNRFLIRSFSNDIRLF